MSWLTLSRNGETGKAALLRSLLHVSVTLRTASVPPLIRRTLRPRRSARTSPTPTRIRSMRALPTWPVGLRPARRSRPGRALPVAERLARTSFSTQIRSTSGIRLPAPLLRARTSASFTMMPATRSPSRIPLPAVAVEPPTLSTSPGLTLPGRQRATRLCRPPVARL